jgi:predicted metal-dependent hydrolase
VNIAGIDIELIQKDIKNIHLAVYPPDGKVRLAAPKDVNVGTLELYVISKLPWIRRQQRSFASFERQSPREYVSREAHYFLGKKYMLRVNESESVKRSSVSIATKSFIDMTIPIGTTQEFREMLMYRWYREELRVILEELVPKWETILHVKSNTLKVYSMRTKWGSCNTDNKNIMFNIELAKKPLRCIEYVVVSELIHLIDRKHGNVFQALMNQYLPNWVQLRDELNR